MACTSLFSCCVANTQDDDDVVGVGLGRIQYGPKRAKDPTMAITNGEDCDHSKDASDSIHETPAYIVEASVVTVSGLQPVQVFEGTIFQESEKQGLKKLSSNSDSFARKKKRQSQSGGLKSPELTYYQQAALQLLRCGQMLHGSGQEHIAAIMFERSLQVPNLSSIQSPFCCCVPLPVFVNDAALQYSLLFTRAKMF